MADAEVIAVDGREIPVTNPDKVFFPQPELTKLDVVRYFAAVGPGGGGGGRAPPTPPPGGAPGVGGGGV
jgi:bifunctional non-homologous end joining protein LigD